MTIRGAVVPAWCRIPGTDSQAPRYLEATRTPPETVAGQAPARTKDLTPKITLGSPLRGQVVVGDPGVNLGAMRCIKDKDVEMVPHHIGRRKSVILSYVVNIIFKTSLRWSDVF